MTLTLTALSGIPLINPGDDLLQIILTSLSVSRITLQDGDVLILAQKIVSKSEGRLVNLTNVKPSLKAHLLSTETGKDPRLVELILSESNQVLRKRQGLIVVEHKLGFVCANAGIDHSNVRGEWGDHDDWVLLLPENPDASAGALRMALEEASGASIGVMIIDSHGRAWRMGTVGIAIGIAGVPGLRDLRGEEDLFGFELQVTEVAVADELAASASLIMGQVAEGTPIVHARGLPYPLREASLAELLRDKSKDLFR
ncbi:MAG: coenzyme F420-0:L-glutamate ligase [Chloroflexi bacterium]|nr:coenzyme F420-0:L-glutamate ligase [Chloroflexota bacterium]